MLTSRALGNLGKIKGSSECWLRRLCMLRQSSIPSLREGSIGLGWTGASTKALVE